MNILTLYATNSGGTQMAVQLVVDMLQGKSHAVSMKPVMGVSPDEMSSVDMVLFATPTWDYKDKEGMPHEDFLSFMEKAKGKTYEKPFAILVLGDSSYTHFCGAAEHLEAFVAQCKGKLLVPTLKIDGFFFNQEKNSQLVKDWGTQLVNGLEKK